MRHRKPRGKTDRHKMDFAVKGTSIETGWAAFQHRYDTEAQKKYWNEHKPGIMRGWIEQNPGSRPYGFWLFDSPGYRQKLSDGGPDNEALAEIAGTPFFGIPNHYDDGFEIEQDSPVFESEAAFLLRHGLMTQAEKNRLKPSNFEPETLKR